MYLSGGANTSHGVWLDGRGRPSTDRGDGHVDGLSRQDRGRARADLSLRGVN